ncbi:MAG: glycosyltransferase family 4 protein [Candidatus Hydrogenedentes bacterium]|nr:glycosyltransferase family 4 protein [Candidatus Hydrogenedentota bacterium]
MTSDSPRTPLRILLVSNHRRFKINFRAHPWARELAARGHEVDVMCHANTERWRTRIEHTDGFRIIENPDLMVGTLRQGWDPVCALRRWMFLRRENRQYDIIHCLDTRLAVVWPALAYARRSGIPIVSDWIDWWGRGGLIQERRPWWYRRLFAWIEVFFEEAYRNKLDGLTAISHALVDRAVDLGVPRERCLHIPGGANLGAFADVPGKRECRAELGIPVDAPVVCFSGLDVLIDLELAIRAFEILMQRDPRTVLLLVGPTERDARERVSDARVLGKIRALGPIPYGLLSRRLAAADVFLMPYTNKVSNVGRWPNKVGDYMCVGRPTVSNPIGEVKRLFEQYDIGALCDETPEGMAEGAWAYLQNPARSAEVGERARAVAKDVFAWEKLIEPLESFYYDLVEGRLGALNTARDSNRVLMDGRVTSAGAPR